MMTTKQIIERYGEPGDFSNFVDFVLPYKMHIAWGDHQEICQFTVHKKILPNCEAAFACILDHYGQDKIKELGLDQWGGCYNFRKMRGGSKWSRHSWAIAIDLLPKGNDNRTKAPKAIFSQKEYKPLMEIMYEHNFINYGIEKGRDYMHFEIKD